MADTSFMAICKKNSTTGRVHKLKKKTVAFLISLISVITQLNAQNLVL